MLSMVAIVMLVLATCVVAEFADMTLILVLVSLWIRLSRLDPLHIDIRV